MGKKLFLLFLGLLILFALPGCGSGDAEQQAQALVKDYKTKLYTVADYKSFAPEQAVKSAEEYKVFFTQDGYDKFISNRVSLIPLEVCSRGRFNLELTDISFTTVSADKNNVVLDYELTVKPKLDPIDSRASQPVKESGQISLVKEKGEWKIANDHFVLNDLFKHYLASK